MKHYLLPLWMIVFGVGLLRYRRGTTSSNSGAAGFSLPDTGDESPERRVG